VIEESEFTQSGKLRGLADFRSRHHVRSERETGIRGELHYECQSVGLALISSLQSLPLGKGLPELCEF